MLVWLGDNIATILICAALIAVVTLIIMKLVKDKKAGISSCGNNCAHCAMAASCHAGSNKCHPSASNKKGA